MGWGKWIGAIGAGLGGLATGGATWAALPTILGASQAGAMLGDTLTSGGKAATGAAAGMADARTQEAGINQSQDTLKQRNAQLLQNALSTRSGIDLQQREFGLNAPSTRASQAVRGDIMANAQDVQISHPRATIPTITGGLKPSLMSDNTRALGSEMSRKALMDQMAGDTFEPLPSVDSMVPTLTDLPKAGKADTALNMLGTAGSITGILDTLKKQNAAKSAQAAASYTNPSLLNNIFGGGA